MIGKQSIASAFLALAGTMTVACPANARDPAVVAHEAKDEMAAEYATCAAYYVLSSEGMRRANMGPETDKAAADGRGFAETAIETSAKLSSQEVAQARMTFALQTMMRKMNNSYENMSLVAAEHAYKCKDLMEHPDQRFKALLAEKEKLPEPRQPGK
jgi:hypothetical protein